ncbi:MAG: hypothetical protein ACXV6K_09330 [Halobacteriota archaeon]
MKSSWQAYRNLLIVIAVIVILGFAGMAIGMLTLLNTSDLCTTGHHEMTPVHSGACCLV